MKDRGVTLTELIIVVAIIGILAVALGFSYQGWMGRYRVEKDTKELFTEIMQARQMAMTRNTHAGKNPRKHCRHSSHEGRGDRRL